LSSACAAQALPGTLLIGARTFLPLEILTQTSQRLSGQLGAYSTCADDKLQAKIKEIPTMI